MGDALTETLALGLARIADDPEPLIALAGDQDATAYARGSALQAWVRRAVETPLAESEVRDRLAPVRERFRPAREPCLAAAWCIAAAYLGLADLRARAGRLLGSQPDAPFTIYSMCEFDLDLERQAGMGSKLLMDTVR